MHFVADVLALVFDDVMIPMAAGRRVTGRDCRFMVTRTEMSGLQGWFLHRLGCFAVDQQKPSLTTLRFVLYGAFTERPLYDYLLLCEPVSG